MTRMFLLAAAFALPALPALAGTLESATPGALAGRSPHQAYRSAEPATACAAQKISLPAGKLPIYGTHALPQSGCTDRLFASAVQDTARR